MTNWKVHVSESHAYNLTKNTDDFHAIKKKSGDKRWYNILIVIGIQRLELAWTILKMIGNVLFEH